MRKASEIMKVPEIIKPLIKKNTDDATDDTNPIKEIQQGPEELKRSIMAAEEQAEKERRKQEAMERKQEEDDLEK